MPELVFVLAELFEVVGDNLPAWRGEDIADKQQIHEEEMARQQSRLSPSLTPELKGGNPPSAFRLLHDGFPPELAHQHVKRAGFHDFDYRIKFKRQPKQRLAARLFT